MKMNSPYNAHRAESVTVLDIISIIVSIIIVVGLFILSIQGKDNLAQVEISTATDTFIYTLDKNRSLVLEGPLGETFVEIKDGYVDVLDSPGRRKICVNSNPISLNGEWLACLPNKVFLKIIGGKYKEKKDGDIDVLVF